MRRVTLYTRAGCCLCDDVKTVLAEARRELAFHYEEIDIDTDVSLRSLYNDQVPVVTIDGVKAFKYRVDPRQLLRKLR